MDASKQQSERSERLRLFFDFSQPKQSFGMLIDGATRKDLYLIIMAVTVGMLYTVITGFPAASSIFTAYLKEELGISDSLLGVLLALPYVVVVTQIPFARFLQRRPNLKRVLIITTMFVRICFIVLGLVTAFIGTVGQEFLIGFVFFLMGIASGVNWMADLTYQTWLGLTVPAPVSGRWFGQRQKLMTISTLLYALVATFLTNALRSWPYKYALLFCLAGIFGCLDISTFFFVRRPQWARDVAVAQALLEKEKAKNSDEAKAGRKLREKRFGWPRVPILRAGTHVSRTQLPAPLRLVHHGRQLLADLLEPFQDPYYRPVLLFSAIYYFGLQINSPYINVYMLQTLHIPLGTQMALTVFVPGLATILFIKKTGQLSDYFGYRNVLIYFGLWSAISPIAWFLIVPETWWGIILINFAWGITGVATDLAVFNMTIFLAPEAKRPAYITAKAIANNLFGIAPAILIGGLLSDALRGPLAQWRLPWLGSGRIEPLHVLLFLALIIRTSAVLFIAPKLKARPVEGKEEKSAELAVAHNPVEGVERLSYRDFHRRLGQDIQQAVPRTWRRLRRR